MDIKVVSIDTGDFLDRERVEAAARFVHDKGDATVVVWLARQIQESPHKYPKIIHQLMGFIHQMAGGQTGVEARQDWMKLGDTASISAEVIDDDGNKVGEVCVAHIVTDKYGQGTEDDFRKSMLGQVCQPMAEMGLIDYLKMDHIEVLIR